MAIETTDEGTRFILTPNDFKEGITEKFLNRGSRTVQDIADETGVTAKTLYNWRDEHAKVPVMKKNRSTFEKMKLVIEFYSLGESERGEFIREMDFTNATSRSGKHRHLKDL